jgi:hypothetical protein
MWPVLKFFRCFNDFITEKVYNNDSGVHLTQVSLPLIGQQDLVDFFRYRPLLPIGWQIEKILCQHRRKTTNTAPTTLNAIKASSQSTFINEQLNFTCDQQK